MGDAKLQMEAVYAAFALVMFHRYKQRTGTVRFEVYRQPTL
jgi:hypothetical protein